jgi:Dyp-type peroxidase family
MAPSAGRQPAKWRFIAIDVLGLQEGNNTRGENMSLPQTTSAGPDIPGPRVVSSGLSLWLEFEDPGRMGELLEYLDSNRHAIQDALCRLRYVHFARFLPTPGWNANPPPVVAALQVITEFDGELDAYVLDFAMVIGDEFDHILEFVKNRPPLPVRDNPAAFVKFISDHNVGFEKGGHEGVPVYSAYADRTVIDIVGSGGLLPRADDPPAAKVIRSDVQANVLQGLNMAHACHFGLKITESSGARAFLRDLMAGASGLPTLSHGERWVGGDRPAYALTVGLTYHGLDRIGLSATDDAAFKASFRAFVDGPEEPTNARLHGDIGDSDPKNWRLGGSRKRVNLLVSLYADDEAELARQTVALRQGLAARGLTEVVALRADALVTPTSVDNRYVHFGFVDGLSQPRLAIDDEADDGCTMQPRSGVGEFLLGSDYRNVYGGADSLGGLNPALAQNATFAALRIMRQDVAAFERLQDEASTRHRVSREWLAARLMGRWQDGTPLAQSPDTPRPAANPRDRDNFDYAPSERNPVATDDDQGLRCPVGAHIRRLNPRSASVAGKPYSRRLLRRGMPYGPEYKQATADDKTERGLVGLFLCADLDRQFEFMLRQWAQGDQAAHGIRAQQDPIIGAQTTLADEVKGEAPHPMTGTFRIPRDAGQPDIVLDMPRLVTTVGSAYLFMPGLAGLAFLSQEPASGLGREFASVAMAAQVDGGDLGLVAAAATPLPAFDPTDEDFRRDPFPIYAAYRNSAPVAAFTFSHIKTVWVFDDASVTAVMGNGTRYQRKPIGVKQKTGLLTMDDPPHALCRAALLPLFEQALGPVRQSVATVVATRYQACQALQQPVDWVQAFAAPVAQSLFFSLFGLGPQQAADLVKLAEDALNLVSPIEVNPHVEAAVEACAKYLFLHKGQASPGGLFAFIQAMSGPPFDCDNSIALIEHFINAAIMVLAGVLPAKWAIGLATWHLLDNGGALLQALRTNPAISDRVAAEELLRYDTPTPMSLRHAAEDHTLGGVSIQRGDRLMVAWASANRDAVRFGAQADAVDFTRQRGAGWAFGNAPAFECLGKELVLLVMDAVVHELRNANPVPTIATATQPQWTDAMMFRSIEQLPVTCR